MIAGVDEVGRGCIAGPVVAAAVILQAKIEGIKDSKKLSEKKRNELSELIKNHSIYSFGLSSNDEIDEFNIQNATFLAMQRAVKNLSVQPKKILVDGNQVFETNLPIEAIVGGDNLITSISAASIIAKVYRDKIMQDLAAKFPHYSFEKHKGYPTKQHYEAIKHYGICEFHRKSFKGVLRGCLLYTSPSPRD